MNEVLIVGAGISGMTAAINCARQGYEVRVLEKYKKVGGLSYTRPAIDISPMNPKELGAFSGLKIDAPQVTPTKDFVMNIYGKRYVLRAEKFQLYSVERGERPSALDTYLYEIAKKEGVKFEFGHEIKRKNYSDLPPRTIIATGLNSELFKVMDIPFENLYGYVGRGTQKEPARLIGWFDHSTRDYNYYASSNGVSFALCFDRKPVNRHIRERFEALLAKEEIALSAWDEHRGVVPIKSPQNPCFLKDGKILAGTFAGVQDPILLFGVHGALLSGKIAANAVSDREKALEVFESVTAYFKYAWLIKKIILDIPPHPLRKRIVQCLMGMWAGYPEIMKSSIDFTMGTIPGFNSLRKGEL